MSYKKSLQKAHKKLIEKRTKPFKDTGFVEYALSKYIIEVEFTKFACRMSIYSTTKTGLRGVRIKNEETIESIVRVNRHKINKLFGVV